MIDVEYLADILMNCLNPDIVSSDAESRENFAGMCPSPLQVARLRTQFMAMMLDGSMTWAEKVHTYIGEVWPKEKEDQARQWFQEAWQLAFDEPWTPQR